MAARDRVRATAFAARHRIPRSADSYEAVITDPDIDAVYIPLPNSLHGRWTLAALEAGKHVLCEKPFTANAEEAATVAAAADKAAVSGLVVVEAFHYRYHPLAHRMREIVARASSAASTTSRPGCVPPSPTRATSATSPSWPGGR